MITISKSKALEINGIISFIFMTTTDIETNVFLKYLEPLDNESDINVAYINNQTYTFGKFGLYSIVHVRTAMGSISRDGSLNTTKDAITIFGKKPIIMVGIAFGKSKEKQNIGDVLVSDAIILYETARIGKDQTIPRGYIVPSGAVLLNRFVNFRDWKFKLPNGFYANKIVGNILSGEKLIDNVNFKSILFDQYPQAIGGEMEASGLYSAASHEKINEWIIVKGICDWADGNKSENKSQNQTIAIEAAVNLCYDIFSKPHIFDDLISGNKQNSSSPNELSIATSLYGNNENIDNISSSGNIELNVKLKIDPNDLPSFLIENKPTYNSSNLLIDAEDNSQNCKSEIALRVKQIDKYLEEFKYQSAIKAYNDLLEDYAGKSLDNNDKFLIFNGILNCYVNLDDENNIKKYIHKIENLGVVNEINKFHFLCAIYYLNHRDLSKSYSEIKKAIEYKSDYFKALCLKILIECEKQIIDYDIAVSQLVDNKNKPILGSNSEKDNSFIFNTLGDISLLSKMHDKAIEYYTIANDIIPSPLEKAHIGIAYFFRAVKNATNDNFIQQKDVDYRDLNYSISIFDELYNFNDDEVRHTIRRKISSIYFRCLYLANSHGKINNIFNDLEDYCHNEKSELYRMKAISEAIKGKVNPETLKKLSPEEQYEIKLIHYMEEGKFEKVIEELGPFIWDKYKDNDRYHAMILQSYLKIDNMEKRFIKHLKKYRESGRYSEIVELIEGFYYEKDNDIPKAEKIIKDIAVSAPFKCQIDAHIA